MIESYRFGRIRVGGRDYTSDVIIYPGRVDASWWRQEGHLLQLADLAEVLREPPEVLVVGRGAQGVMKVAPEVEERLAGLGVELIARRSPEACEAYNRLHRQRRTIACIHLTC